MKIYHAVLFFAAIIFAGCATETMSTTNRPYVYINSAKKIGNGPRATSDFAVVLHYKNVAPGKHEISLGFGYIPSPDSKVRVESTDVGIYSVAYSHVIENSAGELHVTISPREVQKLGTMDGKLHVILARYPHGNTWDVTFHDVFALDPE